MTADFIEPLESRNQFRRWIRGLCFRTLIYDRLNNDWRNRISCSTCPYIYGMYMFIKGKIRKEVVAKRSQFRKKTRGLSWAKELLGDFDLSRCKVFAGASARKVSGRCQDFLRGIVPLRVTSIKLESYLRCILQVLWG